MKKNSGWFRRYVMSFSFKERRARELVNYRRRVSELKSMESDEIDFEYINLKSECEHKKSVLTIFMISIALAVLINVWKYFFVFVERMLQYAASFGSSEIEIAKVSFAISAIVVAFITFVILAILITHMKEICQIQKELMIIEVGYKEKCNPHSIDSGGGTKVRSIIQTEKTNRGLLKICLSFNGEKWCEYNDDIPLPIVLDMLKECKKYLDFGRGDLEYKLEHKPLSNRQIHCATYTSRLIAEEDFVHALHEFMDCIDDYGTARKELRQVSVNEYALYMCLLEVFISNLDVFIKSRNQIC